MDALSDVALSWLLWEPSTLVDLETTGVHASWPAWLAPACSAASVLSSTSSVFYATKRRRYWLAAMAGSAASSAALCLACKGLGDGAELFSVSCADWRGIDVVALVAGLTLVAGVIVGLALCPLSIAVGCVVPARALHLAVPDFFAYFDTSGMGAATGALGRHAAYSEVVSLLFWANFVIVGSVLVERWIGEGETSLSAALNPQLRQGGAVHVIFPWLAACAFFTAPAWCDASFYYPSIWGCRLALSIAIASVPSPAGADADAKAETEAAKAKKDRDTGPENSNPTSAGRTPASRLVQTGGGKPRQLDNWARRKLGSLLKQSTEPTEWNPNPLGVNVSFVKIHVEGEARVEPMNQKAKRGKPTTWAPVYSLSVDTQLEVKYKGLKLATPAVCHFVLQQSIKGSDVKVTADLNAVPTSGGAGQSLGPTDRAAYAQAHRDLTNAAIFLRNNFESIIDELEEGMLKQSLGALE